MELDIDYEIVCVPDSDDKSRVEFHAMFGKELVGQAVLVKPVNGFCAFITDLGVVREHRGKGLAKRIVKEIMVFNPSAIQVTVRPQPLDGDDTAPLSEAQLRSFYASLGFVEFTPRITNMIWPGREN